MSSDKVLVPFTHKGLVNGYPVWIHQSKEHGTLVWPRVFPKVYRWYSKLWSLLFTHDFMLTTRELYNRIYVELDKDIAYANMD